MTTASPAAYDFASDAPYPPIMVVKHTDPETIRQFMLLHAKVVAALPKAQSHFVRPRMRSDIVTHLRHKHAIVAAWSGRKMVGQLLLTTASAKGVKNMGDYPFDAIPKEETLTIQAVGVLPSPADLRIDRTEPTIWDVPAGRPLEKPDGWRGGDLATRMLEAACGEAQVQGRKWVLGKTAEDNMGGRRVFEKAGFKQVGDIAQRGTDSYRSLFMAKAVPSLYETDTTGHQGIVTPWRPQIVTLG